MFGNEMIDQIGDDVVADHVPVIARLIGHFLLAERSRHVYSHSTTNLRAITDSEESHHLKVCWNRRQTECNQTCLNCRGAKEEKPAGLN